jgi:predicted glutamine amidotransferase
MCGIFGYYSQDLTPFSTQQTNFEKLFIKSTSRGREACGIAVQPEASSQTAQKVGAKINYLKSSGDSKKFLSSSNYQHFIEKIGPVPAHSVIGHTRMETHGTHRLEKNNQPVISRNSSLTVVHNGIVANYRELWQKYFQKNSADKNPPALDTQVVADYLELLIKKYNSLPVAFSQLYQTIEGTANLATILPVQQTLTLSTNSGSLYWFFDKHKKRLWFASEKFFLKTLQTDWGLKAALPINHLRPHFLLIIDGRRHQTFDLKNKTSYKKTPLSPAQKSAIFVNHSEKKLAEKPFAGGWSLNKLSQLKKHKFDYERIYAIKRCTKCILPASTPFISFDQNGVCNYCLEHQPIKHQGMASLEKLVRPFRKNNGEPDCLVAFSGGRDSSYGLHLIKEKLGMNPLAYTYDWGMISNLGRRNQARMLGKLGVEHILVSADIGMKRKHIRENILAWIKRPHLGMVPLFMQGDKQSEYVANQIMKKYDLKLMFFCRGNELEREEFKAGHSGVKDADGDGVIHNLALAKKLKLLNFYGQQYLRNPSYINSSFWETGLAFFSTYVQPHDFVYLWHYLPWNEETINKTLQKKYSWETAAETSTTWRIGDGTPPFYNYIYYQVQGFTENDSFRSRQIREGILDRETAWKMVCKENRPQYENLKWYFDTLNLNGDMVLNAVDAMQKLY